MKNPKNIGAVILAAGSSSRLGRPKQLVEFKDNTLLQHTIDCVTEACINPAVLVLGANFDNILNQTDTQHVTVLKNDEWQEGIASSIRCGLQKSLELNPSLQHILYLLSDQPYINTDLIRTLTSNHTSDGHEITACIYKNNIGVPALFSESLFSRLMQLQGDIGAKKIMMEHRDIVQTIQFDDGSFDVDTEDDVSKLRATNTKTI